MFQQNTHWRMLINQHGTIQLPTPRDAKHMLRLILLSRRRNDCHHAEEASQKERERELWILLNAKLEDGPIL